MSRNSTLVAAFVCLFSWLVSGLPSAFAQGGLQIEAVPGEPFGVARVTFPAQGEAADAIDTNNLKIGDRNGRVLYPVFTTGKLRQFLGNLLGQDVEMPAAVTVMFLFRGDEPLQVTAWIPQAREFTVNPRAPAPRGKAARPRVAQTHQRLLERWWREYTAVAQQQAEAGDFSPIVTTYLTSMLSRRIGLQIPEARPLAQALTGGANSSSSEATASLSLLLGLEKLKMATLRASMVESPEGRVQATLPPPPPIEWNEPPPFEYDEQAKIEPIAKYVPEECFYVRFGKFSNYLWFSRLLGDYGGDIGSMVTLRGVRSPGSQRTETQLALIPPQGPVEELLGETLIADVALVGRDLYLEDGPALGMMFLVRTAIFGTNLNRNRQTILQRERDNGATLETLKFGDHDVSLLSTPDNRIRSYYVVVGDVHLVTTSRAIVERFLQTAKGDRPLAAAAEFRQARTQFPVSRNDTIFAYFSTSFFRGLLSPQYQIELGRRMRAVSDMQVVQLARAAATAEGLRADDIDGMRRAGFLPATFDRRADGSLLIEDGGRLFDSPRGGRGTFLPIPDVEITAVTPAEAEACAGRADFYRQQWKQLDPVVIALQREAVDKSGLERISIDGRVSLLDEGKYGRLLSVLGPPVTERVEPAAEDVISVQAFLKGGLMDPSIPPHLMFLGVQDAPPISGVQGTGIFKTLRTIQTTPGYLGAWPKPGFLDWLPLGLGGGPPDNQGFSRLLFGLWRRQWDAFSVLSFDPQILARVTPQLKVVPSDQPAQIRVRVADVSQGKLTAWVNDLTYERARQASVGNVRLLHLLSQQLNVSRQDALPLAQSLLDARLVCSLGGEYQLVESPGQYPAWRSSVWPQGAAGLERPAEYRAPLLDWFRGLDSHLTKLPDGMAVHADLMMQRSPKAAAPTLPAPAKPATPPKRVRDF